MTAADTTTELAELAGPCSYQLYPALGLQPAEWCSEDALPGTDRCERHICDEEEGW